MGLIQHENATYGDLILMSDLEESPHVANTVKTMKFFSRLATEGPLYKFVSKIDDDSFLDLPPFYNDFIVPRLERADQLIVMGHPLTHYEPEFPYPSGQFYTVTWNTVLTLARLFAANPIDDEHEDVLIGRLLYENDQSFEGVWINNQKMFDLDEAVWDDSLPRHAVMGGSINPHMLKEDETYLRVAAAYDEHGLKPDEKPDARESGSV